MNDTWLDLVTVLLGAVGSALGVAIGGVAVVLVQQRIKGSRLNRARENRANYRRGRIQGQSNAARYDRNAANAERRAATAERQAAEAIHGSVLTMTRLFQDQFRGPIGGATSGQRKDG